MADLAKINISIEKRWLIKRGGLIGLAVVWAAIRCGVPATWFFRLRVS